ncbi:MAG: FAD-dependent oxidoreductase [Candidatus Hodgkinia cicadicola]
MKTTFAQLNEVTETDLLESETPAEFDQLESEALNSPSAESTSNDEPEASASTKQWTSPAEGELKTKITHPSRETKLEVNLTSKPKPEALVERLVIIGSGLAGYSALLSACSEQTLPLLITGPTLGGSLVSSESLEYWPGAAPNAKSSALAASLHAQCSRLGAKFMFDSVKSINTTAQPHVIETKLNGSITASAIVVATGLTPKTLNLKDEVSLLGRSVFTSAASINGPHKDAAVVGTDSLAINEALTLSTIVSQVTLVCSAPQLSCPPVLAHKLLQTANIRIEYNVTVYAYVTDESTGGPLLWGLALKRSDGMFIINATVTVLALGSEPKVDLLPPSAKTAEGFIKTNIAELNLKGIFAAGSIVESIPNQQIMLSASGFTAASAAVRYLSSVPNPSAVLPQAESNLAEASAKAPASTPTAEVKAAVLAKASESTSSVSKPANQLPLSLTPPAASKTSLEQPPEVKELPSDNKHLPIDKSPSSKQEVNIPTSSTTSSPIFQS